MKNHPFFFCFLGVIIPFYAHADLSSPLMMLGNSAHEKASSSNRNTQSQRGRISENRDISRDPVSRAQAGRAVDASLEPRFQQARELQFLASIAQKMQAQMESVLESINSASEASLRDSSLTESMNEAEQNFLQRITSEVEDQTISQMTETQIAEAIMQEQQKTQRALVAYYDSSFNDDAQEPGTATVALSDYDQIKKDLTATIRNAFIKMQRAYFSNIILPSVIEEEWQRWEQHATHSDRLAPFASTVAMRGTYQDALRAIELRSLTRTAYATDQDLDHAFAQRGYGDEQGKNLRREHTIFEGEDDFDTTADELMRTRGAMDACVKAHKNLQQAWEQYEAPLNSSKIYSDTQRQRSVSPDFSSAEEIIADDQCSKISDNLTLVNSLDLIDELYAELIQAAQGYNESAKKSLGKNK